MLRFNLYVQWMFVKRFVMWLCIVTLRFLASCQTLMVKTVPSEAIKEANKIVARAVYPEIFDGINFPNFQRFHDPFENYNSE